MAAALVCAVTAVFLSVSPDSSQFYPYENFIVSCPSKSWTVFRRTSNTLTPEKCGKPWGVPEGAGCRVGPVVSSNSGLYWCQNHNQTQCSPAANITVSKEKVILKSPLFPVKEGEQITLTCSFKKSRSDDATSNFNASFFLNGDFLGEFPGGEMLLSPVTREHEGLYHCEHPTKARSMQSRLVVKPNNAPLPSAPPSSPTLLMGIPVPRLVCFLVLVLLYTIILCTGISVYRKWSRARAEQKQQASEQISFRRIRDA